MTRKIFRELASVRQKHCISIYIPTERKGDNQKGRIRFKNKIQDLRYALEKQGMQGKQILSFIQPLDMLYNDTEIWRHLSDGLAVFLSPGKFAYSSFPIRFRDHAEVGPKFHLLPLVPVFNGDGRFFILAISLKKARLFEGSRDHMTEIGIEDLVPQSLQDTVGYDYEPKSIQFRTGQSGTGQGMYHGQGRRKDEKKDEIIKHLREVDRNLGDVLQGYDAPLVLACVDYLFPIYRQVNTYANLFPSHIGGNPDELLMQDMHPKAWAKLEKHFDKHRADTLAHFEFLRSKGRTSNKTEEIILAAQEGLIDTLFVKKDSILWGKIGQDNGGIDVQGHKTEQNYCLLDHAATTAFLQDARVYLTEEEEMPGGDGLMAATFRY